MRVARESLDACLHYLSSLEGTLGGAPTLVATRYMAWVESTESTLRSLYANPAVPRALHTNRYWQIRGISDGTQRPAGLIRGEIQDQERVLMDLRDQLQHYEVLLASSPGERFLLCDTNVLIHGKPFHQLQWDEQFTEKRICILVPLVVIDELDSLKDRGVRPAGGVLKDLDRFLSETSALSRVGVRRAVSLQVVDEPTGHERLRSNDDEIVHQMSYFASLSESPLTLMTRDRGMRVRAQSAGLEARYLPAAYERRAESKDAN